MFLVFSDLPVYSESDSVYDLDKSVPRVASRIDDSEEERFVFINKQVC